MRRNPMCRGYTSHLIQALRALNGVIRSASVFAGMPNMAISFALLEYSERGSWAKGM
jgi:hypothetical protein